MSNADKCVLAARCNTAGKLGCNDYCSSYIAIRSRIKLSNMPAAYAGVTIANSPAAAAQKGVYTIVKKYAATFARMFDKSAEPIKSLYLLSTKPGTGKTTTAAAILNEWIAVHYIGSLGRNEKPQERPGYFLSVPDWQRDYNAFTREGAPREIKEEAGGRYYAALTAALHTPMLVMDDVGIRSATEGFRGDLHVIINHRVANNLPIIYTSNHSQYEMRALFDDRLADRMRDLCTEIVFEGDSKRGMRRVRGKVDA